MYSIDFLDIPPLASAGGSVRLPGSKSISNRALLLAALARGESTLHHVLDSDDTRVMLTALEQLGCAIGPHTGEDAAAGGWQNALASGQPLCVRGLDGKLPPFDGVREIFLGNAGTAMRPLTAALAVLGGDFVLDGVPRMRERPIGDLVDALGQLGCRVDCTGQEGYPPLRIRAPRSAPGGSGKAIAVRGDVSSQFLTALLMALPLLPGPHVVQVTGELISRPYIRITLELMARFGVHVAHDGWQRFTIPAHSRYQSPGAFVVEPDASSASYFLALGAIASDAGIRLPGLGRGSIQGDIAFAEAAQRMGAHIEAGADGLIARRGRFPLQALDMDCTHIPDAAMTLAIMALYATGTTTLRGIASWRVKETDRIAAMAAELRKLGAQAEEGPDFLRITPPASVQDWKAARIATYDDHRMAMCFSLAACNPAGQPVRMEEPRCVGKTFPDYFETLFCVSRAAPGQIPVLCVDGPGACGKGTLAANLARALGYHLLDSGALYRAAALAVLRAGHQDRPEEAAAYITRLVRSGGLRLDARQQVLLKNNDLWEDVSRAIRVEAVGMCASRLAADARVRAALVDMQRACAVLPGLVADGRDMGSHIFPGARLKVYLTASVQCRAQRRLTQLRQQGINTTMPALLADLQARDAQDSLRTAAPLQAAGDSLLLDSTDLSAEQVLERVLTWWQARQPFDAN